MAVCCILLQQHCLDTVIHCLCALISEEKITPCGNRHQLCHLEIVCNDFDSKFTSFLAP